MTSATRTHARDTAGARRTLATVAAAKRRAAVVAWMGIPPLAPITVRPTAGNPRLQALHAKAEWTDDDWAYATRCEADEAFYLSGCGEARPSVKGE